MSQDGHCIGELPGATLPLRWRFAEVDIKRWIERKKRSRSKSNK